MVVGEHRTTKLVIDRDALRQNIKNEKSLLASDTNLFAVVKANAYGHGLVQIAQEAIAAGADGLCVAILDEALELRNAAIDVPILVLGITEVDNAAIAQQYNISLTVGSVEWLQDFQRMAFKHASSNKLNVHLAVDTGMGRIGFREIGEFKQALQLVNQAPFNFEGLFTHFATADETNQDYFNHQMTIWHQLTDDMDTMPPIVHVANSATSLWHLPVTGNMIRFGMAMYGLNPSGYEIETPFKLKPVLSLVTKSIL